MYLLLFYFVRVHSLNLKCFDFHRGFVTTEKKNERKQNRLSSSCIMTCVKVLLDERPRQHEHECVFFFPVFSHLQIPLYEIK